MQTDDLDKTRRDIRMIVSKMRDNWQTWDGELSSLKNERLTQKAAFVQETLDLLTEDVYQCSMMQRRLPENPDEQFIYDIFMCRRDVAAETEKAIRNAMEQADIDGEDPTDMGFEACFTATREIMPVIFARLMLSNHRRLDETANYLMAGWAATYLKPGKRVINFLEGDSFKDSVQSNLYEELPGAARLAYADLQVQPEKQAQQLLKCVRDNIGYPSKLRNEGELREEANNGEWLEDQTSIDPINLFLERETIYELIRDAKIKKGTNEWCVLQNLLECPYLATYGGNIELGKQCSIKPNQVAVIKVTLHKKLEAAEKALQEAV